MPRTESPPDIAIMRLPEFFKKFIRRYVDSIGLYRHCPHAACGRAGRCATRDVLCYQVLREEINAHLRPAVRARLEKEGLLPPVGGV
jgi:hypothetical protein